MKAVSGDSESAPSVSIRETVIFPDQAVVFLQYPPSSRLLTKEDIHCVYVEASDSAKLRLKLPPAGVDGEDSGEQIVRCPLSENGSLVSLAFESDEHVPPGPSHRWDSLVYEAMIDRDNTTVVFVKGLNLRPERVSNASRFECVYGWDFRKPRFLLRSDVESIAQEIVRCKTPLSVLSSPQRNNASVKVSIRVKGGPTLRSIARPRHRAALKPLARKHHSMCICTMVRNQARFIREWVVYHARVGVQRWFIYDNNSEDNTDDVIESLADVGYNISRHVWPWIKTQEGGFAHCAMRARDACEWVGFIDVDEFFHLPTGLFLNDILRNASRPRNVGELRVSCHSFGPSGLKHAPRQGVTVGYTCRMAAPERHKSIVRPEALNSTLINVVHHFHLRTGFNFANMDRGAMVINHYKYQVWEVFKEKFYRRVATYVADWKEEQNVGSKDRAPGLGTKAVEPPDWSSRFCEVEDTGLRDRVLQVFADPRTRLLPWQEEVDKPSPGMVTEEPKQSPKDPKNSRAHPNQAQNGSKEETLFSPRLKSAAAMAGWDEETLVIASLIVDDTPVREFKQKKRSDLNFKTPPSNSRRKRRDQRKSPAPLPVTILNLDDEEAKASERKEEKTQVKEAAKNEEKGEIPESGSCDPSPAIPCLDRLREELSCAICLEVCFEPSTTSCGHSFCKKCLQSAADKCGKRCPKCRQIISNGRSCPVNTVLWNTIQLLFPKEIETRKAAKSSGTKTRDPESQKPERREGSNNSRRSLRPTVAPSRDAYPRRRRGMPSQDEDAALALRLQREEFMEAFRGINESSGTSLSSARANLRAMASRAINLRIRSQPT
ncbi:glycosyltransferase family 92 protein RCOM_0530710 [Rhodamnia argentea]|uniref:Glycosyltransferase family 92 protein RCOM_0530710 n=1 Tax=Rhodamnia argentea TaxID=178133 RepID=A0A8B8QE12_9MYRT|nr:glycosyltransferase family 92 protein RCOM_0530710 [Rhodamnia argentea]